MFFSLGELMKKGIATAFVIALTVGVFLVSLMEGPVTAACCYGARKIGIVCNGDGVSRLIGTSPSYPAAQCATDTSDYYGVVSGCVTSSVDTTSPPCY
jgi:hypothetical protein